MKKATNIIAFLLLIFLILGGLGFYYHNKNANTNANNNSVLEEENPNDYEPVIDQRAAFLNNTIELYKYAQQQWISDSMLETRDLAYCNVDGCEKTLSQGYEGYTYFISFDKTGKVNKYYITNGTYQYGYTGEELLVENISEVQEINGLEEQDIITITPNM